MLNWTMPWSCQRAVSNTSRSRSMWKKNGVSSVGAEMFSGCSATACRRGGRRWQWRQRCRPPSAAGSARLSKFIRAATASSASRSRGRQRIARHEHGADAVGCVERRRGPRANDGEVIARAADAHLHQRRRGERRQPIDLARPIGVIPPRDGQDAARREVIQKDPPGVRRCRASSRSGRTRRSRWPPRCRSAKSG